MKPLPTLNDGELVKPLASLGFNDYYITSNRRVYSAITRKFMTVSNRNTVTLSVDETSKAHGINKLMSVISDDTIPHVQLTNIITSTSNTQELKVLGTKVTIEQYNQMQDIAADKGVTMSDLLRDIIKNLINSHSQTIGNTL